MILSRTAPPDNTPPYARFTVRRFLDNLDLLYSAGLKWGIKDFEASKKLRHWRMWAQWRKLHILDHLSPSLNFYHPLQLKAKTKLKILWQLKRSLHEANSTTAVPSGQEVNKWHLDHITNIHHSWDCLRNLFTVLPWATLFIPHGKLAMDRQERLKFRYT